MAGIADFIEKTGRFQVDVASLEPYVTRQTCREIDALSKYRVVSIDEAAANLRNNQYRSLLIGGGPLMSSIAECHDLNWLCSLAEAKGATVGVIGCGVGPLGYRRTDMAIADLLNTADEVILRDTSSLNVARHTLGVARDMKTAVDPAYFWFRKFKQAAAATSGDRTQVALALRDWPVREYSAHRARLQKRLAAKQHFEAELQRLISGIDNNAPQSFEFQLVCMHTLAVGGDDRAFYRRLYQRDAETLAQITGKPRRPDAEATRLASADCVLAMRFHSVVAAVALEKPLVAIDYTFGGKTQGFLRDLKAESHLVDPVSTSAEEMACRLQTAAPAVLRSADAHSSEQIYLDALARLLN